MRATLASARTLVACALIASCISMTGGATRVDPAHLDAHWLRAAPTPVVVQREETDCGLAALAMIAGTWGRRWSVEELARRVPPKGGVKLGALRDLARAGGLEAYAIRATFADLHHELAAGRPVVLGLVLPVDRQHNRSHYEVAVALDPANDTVVTIDPASGQWQRRSAKLLDVEWKAAGYAALVVTADRVLASRRWPSPSSTTQRSSSASMSPTP